MSSIVIQKFGGTSVQDAPSMKRAMNIVASHGIKRGQRPLVVLSACAGVTNELIRIGELALLRKFDLAQTIVTTLEERHHSILRDLKLETSTEQQAALDLRFIWKELRTLIRGIELLGELTPKMKDKLVSAGERASTILFSFRIREYLHPKKIAVELKDSRDFFITDSQFTLARPQVGEITKRMKPIVKALHHGTVIITQGFVGATKRNETTTIGRGGSDFSATIMGIATAAKEIQIWTDVAGIYTCDPRITPNSYAQQIVNFADASTMAFFGAKVLHPETIGPAVEANIPVRVLSSKEPSRKGTTIVLSTSAAEALTGIAIQRNVFRVSVTSGELLPQPTILSQIFDALAECKVVPLASSLSFDNASVVLSNLDEVHALESALSGVVFKNESNRALLTLVGHGLLESQGIAARLFSALKKIDCQLISYGGAANAVSIIIAEDQIERSVLSIHREFFEK